MKDWQKNEIIYVKLAVSVVTNIETEKKIFSCKILANFDKIFYWETQWTAPDSLYSIRDNSYGGENCFIEVLFTLSNS